MDKNVILSVLRQVLTALGAGFATKYGVDGETTAAIIAGLVALISAVWAAVSKSKDVATVAAAKTVLTQSSAPVTQDEIAQAAASVQK